MHREEEVLCKAHILPRSFYMHENEDKNALFLYEKDVAFPKRRPAGIYDPKILCASADNEIGVYDQYGADFFTWERSDDLFIDKKGRKAYQIKEFKFDLLNLFIMSYIWRCHHSKLSPYRNFSIGTKFEELFREKISRNDGSAQIWFSFVLFHFKTSDHYIPFKFPVKIRIDNFNCVVIYILNYKAVVFLDSRGPPKHLLPFLVRPEKSIYLATSEYIGSAEFQNDMKFVSDLDKIGAR